MVLKNGQMSFSGQTDVAITQYVEQGLINKEKTLEHLERRGNRKLTITHFRLEDAEGKPLQVAYSGQPVTLVFGFRNDELRQQDRVSVGFSIKTHLNEPLLIYYSDYSNVYYQNLPPIGEFRCQLADFSLKPGAYMLGFRVVMNGSSATGKDVDYPSQAVPLKVVAGDYYGIGSADLPSVGYFLIRGQWS